LLLRNGSAGERVERGGFAESKGEEVSSASNCGSFEVGEKMYTVGSSNVEDKNALVGL
jgi:hypothetical protein